MPGWPQTDSVQSDRRPYIPLTRLDTGAATPQPHGQRGEGLVLSSCSLPSAVQSRLMSFAYLAHVHFRNALDAVTRIRANNGARRRMAMSEEY